MLCMLWAKSSQRRAFQGRTAMRKSWAPAVAAGAIAVSLLALSAPSQPVAAEKVVWNHNIFGPPRAVTAGIEAMVEFYKKESKGDLEIKIAYGAALGPEKQTPESIKSDRK